MQGLARFGFDRLRLSMKLLEGLVLPALWLDDDLYDNALIFRCQHHVDVKSRSAQGDAGPVVRTRPLQPKRELVPIQPMVDRVSPSTV
jgi:hypothetical protein